MSTIELALLGVAATGITVLAGLGVTMLVILWLGRDTDPPGPRLYSPPEEDYYEPLQVLVDDQPTYAIECYAGPRDGMRVHYLVGEEPIDVFPVPIGVDVAPYRLVGNRYIYDPTFQERDE